MSLTAYDYCNQTWVTGTSAKILRRQQLYDELRLLESPRGGDYFNFTRSPHDRGTLDDAISTLKARLKAL